MKLKFQSLAVGGAYGKAFLLIFLCLSQCLIYYLQLSISDTHSVTEKKQVKQQLHVFKQPFRFFFIRYDVFKQ